ncbi:MAG: PIG-L deacetylase family protein [Actinomycetes bacterium]
MGDRVAIEENALIDVGNGTDEAVWRQWSALQSWPRLDLSAWAGRRVVVLAAHPDDEVLALGGTLALLAGLDADLTLVWATHGEASHPGSTAPQARELVSLRMGETRAALARLGVLGAQAVWLGLPDGGLEQRYDDLVRVVRELHRPGDLLLAPYRGDGHPDHEACGRAAAEVEPEVVEFPIWAWHWASPGDSRVPWERARVVPLPPDAHHRKAQAIDEFHTQVRPIGPAAADGPVLPERVLAHFRRHLEVVFT